MKIELWLKDCANPRVYEDVINLFQEGEGSLICIDTKDKILKYPIGNVFRIVEYK
ncbi:hypothetical protein J1TS3_37490 [Siminovitchia fordii]|uniref:Uncharacterized protein n=1 Tax=Siminovitchia fordii TaxID=254759 RepID=A0ABQ4KA65_9BACI|nr:hypothetical protein J1TS3_37490 [Siminovitchia fordii]